MHSLGSILLIATLLIIHLHFTEKKKNASPKRLVNYPEVTQEVWGRPGTRTYSLYSKKGFLSPTIIWNHHLKNVVSENLRKSTNIKKIWFNVVFKESFLFVDDMNVARDVNDP